MQNLNRKILEGGNDLAVVARRRLEAVSCQIDIARIARCRLNGPLYGHVAEAPTAPIGFIASAYPRVNVQ